MECGQRSILCTRILIKSMSRKAKIMLIVIEVGDGYKGSSHWVHYIIQFIFEYLKCFGTKELIGNTKVQQ